nr:hypothetical protein [Glycomyces terrestris]
MGFSSRPRQHANTRRAPGAAARRRFANAASGSSKNMTPKRETIRSKGRPPPRRSAVCASATTTVASGTRLRAAAAMPSAMSTPTASAPAAVAASRSVPAPHPTSSTRCPPANPAAVRTAPVTGAKTASNTASFATHPAALSVQSSRIDSFATATPY